MRGYRNDPGATHDAIDSTGWLHTGDIVSVDRDGHLRIVDRKKDLIITEAGKNIAPAAVESAIEAASPLIGTVVAVGDQRPYLTALIVLDRTAAAAYAAEHGLNPVPEALARSPRLIEAIAADLAEGNRQLSRVEQVKRFRVLPVYWEASSDELTSTLKLKRRNVTEKYAGEISELYAGNPGPDVHQLNGSDRRLGLERQRQNT
ncbi:AMP-binding protein [Amycolatopsis mediterranei]|nr:AMP-binding protein [Amycolatopsis mediterranei]AEK45900.1 acyl-CoA synthetase-related protein [Amycolatopsis mediterranei S699]